MSNKLVGICPHCGLETKIEKSSACYCMCNSCNKIYNIMGDAKIQGVALSEQRMEDLIKEIEKDVSSRVSNWRVV